MRSFKSMFVLCALALSAALLAGCADTAATQTLALNTNSFAGIGDGGNECSQAPDAEAMVLRVIELVNEERAKIGMPPLSENDTLRQVAEDYACRMIEEDFFAHYTPEGDGPGERAVRGGYVFMKLGENLAAGQTSAEQVMGEWMSSDQGHRENILSPDWREIGMAVRTGGEHGTYWVQEFGDPPGR